MKSATKIHEFQSKMFDIYICITYILTFASYLGISSYAPKYLNNIDSYIKIYVCLFLIWRFNPLRKNIKFDDLDRKIVFSSGLFILTTTALNVYLTSIQKKVVTTIHNFKQKHKHKLN